MGIQRGLNVFIGGAIGCTIASFSYLLWYTADGGALSEKGTKDMILCMVAVGAGSSTGSLAGHLMTRKPKPKEETVREWLTSAPVVLKIDPSAYAEVMGALEDV